MQLPLLLPQTLAYCESARDDGELYALLLRSTPDFLAFTEIACDDETWAGRHPKFMRAALKVVTARFFQDRLEMTAAQKLAQVIRAHYASLRHDLPRNLLLKLQDRDLPINSLLYGSSSQTLRELIRHECRDRKRSFFTLKGVSSDVFNALAEFIETGSVKGIYRKDKDYTTAILNQALQWDLKELAEACEHYLQRDIDRNQVVEMLLEAHAKGWRVLRQGCMDFINALQLGVALQAREDDRLAFEFLEFKETSRELFEKLRSFISDLVFAEDLTDDPEFARIVTRCPHLVCVDISHTRRYTDLLKKIPSRLPELWAGACPWLNEETLKELLSGFSHLRKLVLTSDANIGTGGWSALAKLPQLETLDISRCSQVGDEELILILQACTALTELAMEECRRVSERGFFEIPKLNPQLLTLNISRCNITDAGLVELGAKFRSLTSLNLTRCEGISDRAVEALVSLLGSLRFLDITQCNVPPSAIADLNRRYPYLKIKV